MGFQRIFTDIAANSWSAARVVPIRKRWMVLRTLGVDAEESVILPGCYFGGTNIHIGLGSFISNNCYFDNAAPIYIGEGVDVGPNVQFITGTHEIGSSRRRAGVPSHGPIRVNDGAWIGAGVTIQPGVTIGAGSIVNAGSVVTKDVSPDSLYRGVPATFVRSLH
jgi:maltose O-acetyltransferase